MPAAASWSPGGSRTGSRSGSNSACCRHHPNDQPIPPTWRAAGERREASPAAYAGEATLPAVTDEMLGDALQRIRPYTVCILKAAPLYQEPGPTRESWVADLIWEHGKRNYALYLADLMRIVCPIGDSSGTTGVSIFDADPDEVDRIMRQDPGVKAGLFTYEIHATQTFPESKLTSASPTA